MLSVRGLCAGYATSTGEVPAVDDVSFDVGEGEIVGVVGESGSGKTTLARALLRILRSPGMIKEGEVLLGGTDLLTLTPDQMRLVRGSELAMIFQNPMRSLHPGFTIGRQLAEAITSHHDVRREHAMSKVVEALEWVGVPDAVRRLNDYPHQFSGGMQQRAMIAMALLNGPRVLVADEPTTALDVTIQAQILALLRRLADERGMSVVLVTHNLGVVASVCDTVIVMYAGSIVEEGPVERILSAPAHPYTEALLASLPEGATGPRLPAIPGTPPSMSALPAGCRFLARCSYAVERCSAMPPLFEYSGGRRSRCWVVEGAGGVLVSIGDGPNEH